MDRGTRSRASSKAREAATNSERLERQWPVVAVRGESAQNQLYGLAGYEIAFSQTDLKRLTKDKKDYMRRVDRSLDEATRGKDRSCRFIPA